MDSNHQGPDDIIEELLKQTQEVDKRGSIPREQLTPYSGFSGAGSARCPEEVVKKKQQSIESQVGYDGGFLDEYFVTGQHGTKGIAAVDGGLLQDPLFQSISNGNNGNNDQQQDDRVNTYLDELPSSLDSNVHIDFFSPVGSYYQPQRLNSLDSHSCSQYLSSSQRSPVSARTSTNISSSLRSQTLPHRARHSSLSSSLASTPVIEDTISAGSTGNSHHLSGSNNMTQEEKLRRRREFHNAVERRRRELIKSKIKELGKLVPPSLLNYNENGKEVRLNKGIILHRTVEYLDYLKQVLDIQDHKKIQLKKKLCELEQRRREIGTQPLALCSSTQRSRATKTNSPEQIIDGRALPQITKEGMPLGDNHQPLSDDLQQFLSGDQMEQADNSMLMFNAGTENPANFLLGFKP
ncbi:Rtg3p Ecym_8083 [Eremothecium cymbalariae DBVPG|uniref:BHLH domain-containing protein n=1 Tax=Eremothecium cymbalariae (strain CBS 270.75 / DBVPG 7215 / KCTC 17166 / NRRL Y-17582) TaxID=931890 RepID=G8JX04_ERECY|nr:Hypothetical protein Ecym_8083 [Eremothecium cymbalariae DBVPG\